LGTRRDSAYKTGHLRLVPGEAIYLYTDGITEAANRTDEMFTEQRLEAILREASPFRPKDVIQAVADAVQSFANSVPQSDDITAMAIRLLAR
jgi:serine phosphatase RsbU (regulator of sigma subunit)